MSLRTADLCADMPTSKLSDTILTLVMLALACTIVGLLLVPIIWPLWRVMHYKSVKAGWTAKVQERFATFIGSKPQYVNVEVFGYGSSFKGTGIAYKDRKFFVMEAGVAVEIDWSDVREWSYHIADPGQTQLIDGNAAQHNRNNLLNAQNAAAAHASSGFTVRVADVDKPSWTFRTTDESICLRWLEIFQQVNEGRLAKAA